MHLQDEGSVRGDEAREATVTVGVVAVQWLASELRTTLRVYWSLPSDGELGLLAERHATISGDDALVPTCTVCQYTYPGSDIQAWIYVPLMTWPTPILVLKSPRPTLESNCLPFSRVPVYSMVMLSPALGLSTPLPGEICCLVTPMLIAVRVKDLV